MTDLNNAYLERGLLQADILEGWWSDAGSSIDGYLEANMKVAGMVRRASSERRVE